MNQSGSLWFNALGISAGSADAESPIHSEIPAVLLDHRVAADHRGARDQVLARHLDALARRREFEAVIHAAQIVTLDAPARQRRQPVAAAVFQRRHTTIGLAVEHDRLAEYPT